MARCRLNFAWDSDALTTCDLELRPQGLVGTGPPATSTTTTPLEPQEGVEVLELLGDRVGGRRRT